MDNNQISQEDAQQRVEQINAYKQERIALQQAGIYSPDENENQLIDHYHQQLIKQLCERFDVDTTANSKQLTFGMKIASLFGALAMAVSIFFLFYQFWGLLGTTIQVSILVLVPVALFLLTLHLAQDATKAYFSKISALVTLASFVLNLTMLGEIFNITPSPNAFIVWSAFSFLLAYACNARLLVFFGIVGVTSYIATQVGTWNGMYWISFGERPENFFIPAIITFFVPHFFNHKPFAGFATIYRVMAMIILFIPILILANWGEISYLTWNSHIIEGSYQVAGFILSACAIWLGIKYFYNDVVNTGNVFFVLFLFTKLFDWWWDWMPKYIFFFLLGLTALLVLVMFKRIRTHNTLNQALPEVRS